MRAPLGLTLAVALACGCRSTDSPDRGPYGSAEAATATETAEAERLTKQAAELLETDPERAEGILREALALDLFHGPAHNNLGVVHLMRGELYEAANEFEWARKLLPGHPDPRVNLALTLEQAGRVDDSVASFEAALEVYPNYLPAIQGMARVMLWNGRDDERLAGWLDEIAMRSEDADWREWAREAKRSSSE